jgi:beta-glucosidase-like glycosyl hydrolase
MKGRQVPRSDRLGDDAETWVGRHLESLSPRQKLAQLLVAVPGMADGRPDQATRAALGEGLGVLHGLRGTSVSGAARYHIEVTGLAADLGLPPALVAANLESGVGYTLGGGGTDFPYPRGIGHLDDAEIARDLAEQAAREARLVGFHWTLSPCVDVPTTPDDPILGVRAFGLDAERTAILGAAQIRGYQTGGLLATAKHFPGHGDSPTDTHLDLASLPRTPEEHEQVHLPPFRAAIAAGVASVMVAHVALPGLGVDVPASLSPLVNRTWLRADLAYDGIIVTDALHMGAIAKGWSIADSAVASLAAGADVANVQMPGRSGTRDPRRAGGRAGGRPTERGRARTVRHATAARQGRARPASGTRHRRGAVRRPGHRTAVAWPRIGAHGEYPGRTADRGTGRCARRERTGPAPGDRSRIAARSRRGDG